MKTMRVCQLKDLSPPLFQRLREAQMEAAQVWNLCVELHKAARMARSRWPRCHDLAQATKGQLVLNAQAVQQIVHAFLGKVEITRKLRKEHPEMRTRYPCHEKRFYPVKWPAQAIHKEKGRVILPLALPENARACTSTTSRINPRKLAPRARPAPNEAQAAGVRDAGTNTGPKAELGRAAGAVFEVITTLWEALICIWMPLAFT
jgi:hypothetical protein